MPLLARSLARWRLRSSPDHAPPDLWGAAGEIEAGLREIDFDEVTVDDRVTFVEYAVVWQVRRALQRERFDLALDLQRYGMRRIARLRAEAVQLHSRDGASRS